MPEYREYKVEPEVAGGFGDNTVIDHSTRPITVTRLHYEIETWLGSELLETYPSFIASDRLIDVATAAGLTGFTVADAEVTVSDQGRDYMDVSTLPHFRWFKPTGTRGVDDFSVDAKGGLVASARALDTIRPLLGEDLVVEEVVEDTE